MRRSPSPDRPLARKSNLSPFPYDRYGRLLQDGDLTLSYDENGNALTLEYPGGVTAVYDYNFADRPVSLTVQRQPGDNMSHAALSR